MVKSLGRLLAIPAVVLPLASCIFVLSAFPPTLSQVLARADLSGTIPAGTGSQYQPYIVTPTGGEFVILLNRSMSMDPAAVVMDSNLNVIQTYTDAQLTGWGISPGGTLLTDALGNVAFPSKWFRAADLATVNSPPFGVTTPLFGASFSSPAGNANVVNFQVSGNALTYSQYDSSWGLVFTGAGILVNGAGGNYNVVAVYNVGDAPAAGEVVLVLSDFSNSLYLIDIPLFDILNNSVASPLFSSYPYATLTNINSSSIGFAGDSLVAYNYNSGALIRYSVKPPFSQISSLSIGNNNGNTSGSLQYAYKMTGGYSVVYDGNARKLTKVANWW
jgi:hypothetical protein